MALRAFFVVLLLIAGYVGFQIVKLRNLYGAVFDVPYAHAYGPENADLKVVEFLDYACPHCREIHPAVMEAVRRDGNVLYMPRPLPSPDSQSVNSSLLVYNAGRQGKFIEMHEYIMQNYRPVTEESLEEIARLTGVDLDRMAEDAQKENTADWVIENGELFQALGGRAFPAFLIGPKIFYVPTPGQMPSAQDFLAMFAEARARD